MEFFGMAGDDTLRGRNDRDRFLGRAGNDAVSGGGDVFDDRAEGGSGNDAIYGSGGRDTLVDRDGNDRIFGGDDGDILGGHESDDYVVGRNDVISGGGGNDVLGGDTGEDRVEGGVGNALIYGSEGREFLIRQGGNEQVFGDDEGDHRLDHGNGNDAIYGTGGRNFLVGQAGNEQVSSGSGGDLLGGDDRVEAGNGNDAIFGSGGRDFLIGQAGNDRFFGGDNGGSGSRDYLIGQGANDRVFGNGDDILGGDEGDDRVEGGNGNDAIYGSGGRDTLFGQAGNDDLFGGSDDDLLEGGDGQDRLFGEAGNDTLAGGEGADTFAFTTTLGSTNVDTIQDFNVATDRILLGGATGQAFAALASGVLSPGAFVIGTAAGQPDDVIIYNSATGALLYDRDGSGGAAAVQFAQLSPGLALTAGHFTVSGPPNNLPVITSGSSATIAENSPAGTIVYQAAANDPDGDAISFSLAGQDAHRFTIDAMGAVRLVAPADFETQSSYSFSVVASDSGPNDTLKQVTVTVGDVVETVQSTPVVGETSTANDSIGTAQRIDRGTLAVADNPNLPDDGLPSVTIQGAIGTNADRDFFSITLQEGELLILDIDGVTPGFDTLIKVFGPNGVEIGENDDLVNLDPGSSNHPQFGHNTDSFFRFRAPSSGTYTFSIESFEQTPGGSYSINVSVGPVATAAQLQEEDIQSLLSGVQWSSTNLSYSFPTSALDYSDYPPAQVGETNEADNNFEALNSTQQSAVRQMLAGIANFTNLTFTEFTSFTASAPRDAQLRYAMTDETEAAHAYLPFSSSRGGDSWYRNTGGIFDNPRVGDYAYMGFLHETGHALGLKHGHEVPALSPGHDTIEFSVMTYRSYEGAPIDGYRNETFGYAQTFMMYDIAALQRMYGADFTFNGGNTVYQWNTGTGQMSINGVGQATPGGNRILMTIWDGGGNDTYDLSNYNNSVIIDLRPGEWTTTSQVQLANLGDGNLARGNVANSLLFNGDTRSLIENAIGGSQNDTLIANATANRLTGNGGGDRFQWHSAADSRVGLADIVTDFQSGLDTIDLSFIDANSNTEGNDSFRSIGSNAFTGSAGELRQQVIGNELHIFGDVNGDGVTDFEIILANTTALGPNDILF